MSELRVLVVEDDQRWQHTLAKILRGVGDSVEVTIVSTYEEALSNLMGRDYDLAIVDLSLLGIGPDLVADELGLNLLREFKNRGDRSCAVIVLTGHGTIERVRTAVLSYGADDFLDKATFGIQSFLRSVRVAVFNARIRRANARVARRYRLTITFGQDSVISSELSGPDRFAHYTSTRPATFDVEDLIRRANNLNVSILRGGAEEWRPEARSIGNSLYEAIAGEQRIFGDLIAARALTPHSSDLWLQLSGPPSSLGLPFELLRDGNTTLSLSHILTRRLEKPGHNLSRKPEPFYQFIKGLQDRDETFRVLIVGANSDGNIPATEEEAAELSRSISNGLQLLGVRNEVTLLVGEEATYSSVTEAIRSGHYHILHYAGHGRFDDEVPEVSGIILREGDRLRNVSASDLYLLTRDTQLRIVYLSCCLGARTATQTGRGDFYGVLEALSGADVPAALGYRWTVADVPAKRLALEFYNHLFLTLSPANALLEARQRIAMGEMGCDDETWASPVLLLQTD